MKTDVFCGKMAPPTAGITPRFTESQRPCDISASDDQSNTCELSPNTLTVKLTVWATAVAAADPHLAAVLAAWVTLPEAAKVEIVAVIRATPAAPSDPGP